MPPRKKQTTGPTPIEAIVHPDKRTNLPTADASSIRHARRTTPSPRSSTLPINPNSSPKARRQRESVLPSPFGSSTSGVGSKLAGEVGILTAVSCEILIVSRSTLKCWASAVAATDSGSVGPRHQDISFWMRFTTAW